MTTLWASGVAVVSVQCVWAGAGQEAYLLLQGLREDDRVGTGIERPLESTSASLFERGTVLTTKQKKPHGDQLASNNLRNTSGRRAQLLTASHQNSPSRK